MAGVIMRLSDPLKNAEQMIREPGDRPVFQCPNKRAID